MPPRVPPAETPRRSAPRPWLLAAAGLVLCACLPGNREAKRLNRACEAGEAAACNGFGQKLLKGEYVLRDPPRAAAVLKKACDGEIADGCARLGVLYQDGTGVT